MNGDWNKAENAARLSFGDFADEEPDAPVLAAQPTAHRLMVLAAGAAALVAAFLLW